MKRAWRKWTPKDSQVLLVLYYRRGKHGEPYSDVMIAKAMHSNVKAVAKARKELGLKALGSKGHQLGQKDPPETREKKRQGALRRWSDPAYKERMLGHLHKIGPKGRIASMRKGQTAETREKQSEGLRRRWSDPAFKERMRPHLERMGEIGRARQFRRPKPGSPEREHYDKVAKVMGADVARKQLGLE